MANLTPQQLRALQLAQRQAMRSDAAQAIADLVADLDAKFSDHYEVADIPTDYRTLRELLAASAGTFASIGNRAVEIQPAPWAGLAAPQAAL